MTCSKIMLGASLALALAAGAGRASAQLVGGGMGAAVGLPGGIISGGGAIGVSRIEREVMANGGAGIAATRRVRSPAVPRTSSVVGAVSSTVTLPSQPLSWASIVVRAVTPAVAVPTVAARISVPAAPLIVERRTAIIDAGIAPVVYDDVPAYVDRQYVLLQDELRETGINVRKHGEQIVLELPSDVNFAFDRYNIQPRFYSALNAVSRVLAQYPSTYVDVNGHTDAIGSYSYNQLLSERRADAVANYLAARSVHPVRMQVQGFGKSEPIATNATIQGRAANRRVEIILTPVEA